MNRRIAAMIACLGVLSCFMTACGDSSDNSGSTLDIGTEATANGTEELESENDTQAAETTTERIRGRGEGVSPKTETTTEKPADTQPATENDYEIGMDVTDMIGMSVPEIANMLGSGLELHDDGQIGCYCMYNAKRLPGVAFMFEDHSWDSLWTGGTFPADVDALIGKLSTSSAKVKKINITEGLVDEFRVGMKYTDCAKIIGDFPVSVSDLGQTVCYEPASVAYYYLNIYNNDCIVGLHFEYTNDLRKAVDAGYITSGSSKDIAPAEIKTFDPTLKVISVIYSPRIDTSDFSASASSSLGDITDKGIKYTYGPANLTDGRLDTCWCEGSTDVGIDQSVTLRSSRLMECKFITVYGGLMTSEEGFYKNCRPLAMDIAPEGVIDMIYYLPTNYNTKYRRSIPVGYIQWDCYEFAIKDVDSSRSEYSDTCISELVFNG